MNIAAADWFPYALSLKRPWQTSQGVLTKRNGRLLRLQSGDGAFGWGDSAPLPQFGISDQAADAFAEECAQLDLVSARSGLPLHQWLSGGNAVRDLAVNGNLGHLSDDTPDALKVASQNGFSVVKIKLGVLPVAEEIARLKDLATASQAGTLWRLDANCAWDFTTAQALLSACADLPIEGLEEPLAKPDHTSLRYLQAMVEWPLALDESIQLIDRDFFHHPSAGRLVLKPARHGGLLASVELALRAQASGIEVIVTSSLESACGLAACAQLAAALSPGATHGLSTADRFSVDTGTPCPIIAGRLQLPRTTGLGFTPDQPYGGPSRR